MLKKLSTAALIAGTAWFASAASVSAQEQVRLGMATWIGYLPVYVAIDQGFYEDHGLDLELITFQGNEAITAFASGRVDMTSTASSSVVALAAQGGPFFSSFLVTDMSVGGDGILARNTIESLEDFAGKTIALETLGVSHFFLLQVLDTVGLTEDDVTLVNLTPDGAAAAYQAGTVDIAVTYAPFLGQVDAQTPDGRIIFDTSSMPSAIADLFLVRNDYLEANPEAVQAFIMGTLDGLAFIEANAEAAYEIGAVAMEVTPEQVAADIGTVLIPNLEESIAAFLDPDSALYLEPAMNALVDFLKDKDQIDDDIEVDIGGLLDPAPMQAVLAAGGY